MKPKISFIVPSYNFADYIEVCVQSILNQTYDNIEVVVVNDGSTDNSKDVIDSIVAKDKRVMAIHKQNEGVSIARNTGIMACNGDYCVFVDADDYLAPDYAEYMLKLVSETGGEFCLSLDCYTKRDEPQTKKEFIKKYSPEEATALLLSPRVVVGSWNKIFKRDFLLENQLQFSPELFYGEGLRFITSVAQCAKCVGVGNRKVYYYRRNNYASATSKFNIEKFYNGMKSIDDIGKGLLTKNNKVWKMWSWHKCQFCMGIVVRMQSARVVLDYLDYYKQNLSYLRHHALEFLFTKDVPLYNKGILIGTAISPSLMSKLDDFRRKKIAVNSVERAMVEALLVTLMGGVNP